MAAILGLVMVIIGLIGLATARNMVRLVISAEIITLGLLATLLISAPSQIVAPAAILLIVLGGAEIVAAVAVMYRLYGEGRTSDVEKLRSGAEQ